VYRYNHNPPPVSTYRYTPRKLTPEQEEIVRQRAEEARRRAYERLRKRDTA